MCDRLTATNILWLWKEREVMTDNMEYELVLISDFLDLIWDERYPVKLMLIRYSRSTNEYVDMRAIVGI
jgi:hypothetical protein